MKRLLITTVSIMAIGLAACGNDTNEPVVDEGATTTPTEQPADTNTDGTGTTDTTTNGTKDETASGTTDDMKADMDKLSFREIEVEISYGNDIEYEAEIEQDRNEPIKAKVEDEVNQVYLKGQEAFDDLYPKVEQLQLTKDSTNEETINQVLKAFGLKSDYQKFDVEIKFNDGSKLDIEERK
ncbi:YusW family protein [Mammaliicoccus sciuri]|uniref:YusW-like protein n=1 Tax=Sporosarcina newyorkensis TaxID=759851 RepID=A0A1T4YUS7_9BACL|nr:MULTISPECIES: YusW family protein [Sporosarcina]MBY0224098.1 hypothetical protein [Sporosarcina aquimarina]SKB05433.1 YusW-like protein [Sporosarcina newyorkensis]